MKLIWFMIMALVAINVSAQEFWDDDNCDIKTKYWTDKIAIDTNISNGIPIHPYVVPAIHGSYVSLNSPQAVCLSYLKDNKFLSLSFVQEYGKHSIILNKNGSDYSDLTSSNGYVMYAAMQGWFNIEWDRIVYNPWFDMIIIPCGLTYDNEYYAICIEFNASSTRTESISSNDSEKTYYDLNGNKIVSGTKGQILVQSNGSSSKKVMFK